MQLVGLSLRLLLYLIHEQGAGGIELKVISYTR